LLPRSRACAHVSASLLIAGPTQPTNTNPRFTNTTTRAHLMQKRLKKNGQLQEQELPAGHSDQPKGSHISGTLGLSCSLTG
jgi:hypothetical protein